MAATYLMTSHWFLLLLLVSVHVEVEEIRVGELEGYTLLPGLARRHFHQKDALLIYLLLLMLLSQVEWDLRKCQHRRVGLGLFEANLVITLHQVSGLVVYGVCKLQWFYNVISKFKKINN